MEFEQFDEHELYHRITMEEFKFWDARRNNVPKIELDEIKSTIKKLKSLRIVSGDISSSLGISSN